MLVLVRSRSVMVIRVIVLRVLVHVHRRNHGGRDNQGVREQESNETPHDDQSIRSAGSSIQARESVYDRAVS